LKIAKFFTSRRGRNWLFSLAFFGLVQPFLSEHSQADAISDLRAVSVFKTADLNKLAGGEVLAARGPAMSFSRGLAVEAAYVVRAPVQRAVTLQQQWNPTRHPELRTYIQADVSGRPSTNDFRQLASAPANSGVRAFADATTRLPGDFAKLQISSAEAKTYSAVNESGGGSLPGSVFAFWSRLLAARAQAYLSGGFSAQPPYENTGDVVRVSEDANRLLREDGPVRSQFAPLIGAAGIGGGRGSLAPILYWQMFDAEGIAAVNLGAFYSRQVGDTIQAADVQYYSSGGFYTALTFYQFWPVTIQGQQATLVWRSDLVSSAALDLRGVERMGSGAAAMREIQKGVKAFLRDVSGQR
jgi:hypothetical protein